MTDERELLAAAYEASGSTELKETAARIRAGKLRWEEEEAALRAISKAREEAFEEAARIAEGWNGSTRDGDTAHIAAAIRSRLQEKG